MISITPSQRMISDRFPVASFVVQVPGDRFFEIACATDPLLFRGEHVERRTPENFFTSRTAGLLRAPAGEATYLMPGEQLRRFAGRSRIYYALGAYRDSAGQGAEFTTHPAHAEGAPFIALSPDFSGRSLERRRLSASPSSDGRYGASSSPLLAWGGDLGSLPAARELPPANPPPAEYDDGYPADLWRAKPAADPADPADPADASEPPPPATPSAEAAQRYGGATAPGEHERYGRPVLSIKEPPGFEDGRALRSAAPPLFGAQLAANVEPAGVEDARALRGAQPSFHPVTYGRAEAAAAEPAGVEDARAIRSTPRALLGVDDTYDDEDRADEGELAAPNLPALTVRRKMEIILPVADFEGGADRYTAINADSEHRDPTHPAYQRVHYGLHWGFVQLNQRSGALGLALGAAIRRDPLKFRETFGGGADQLLRVTLAGSPDARVQPVEGAFLWDEPWLTRFRRAGELPVFQAAQNEAAIERYFDGSWPFAAALGLTTDRALGMVYDRMIHMGRNAGRSFVLSAVSPIKNDADRDRALKALGFESVAAFQRAQPSLVASGAFGPKTHAALLGKLREAGERSPLVLPALPAMLDALVNASRGRRFEGRVASLRTTKAYADVVQPVS